MALQILLFVVVYTTLWLTDAILFCSSKVITVVSSFLILSSKYMFLLRQYNVHRDRFLVNKTNRCTEFQFYWYYDSTCFGQSFCPSSGVLSRTPALVQFMQFCDRVLPGARAVFLPTIRSS
jgi:hypothetical protein